METALASDFEQVGRGGCETGRGAAGRSEASRTLCENRVFTEKYARLLVDRSRGTTDEQERAGDLFGDKVSNKWTERRTEELANKYPSNLLGRVSR